MLAADSVRPRLGGGCRWRGWVRQDQVRHMSVQSLVFFAPAMMQSHARTGSDTQPLCLAQTVNYGRAAELPKADRAAFLVRGLL